MAGSGRLKLKEIMAREGDRVILLKDNLTGRVEEINTELINLLVENNYLPVICSPAISFEKEIVNTDNDWAIAIMAEKLKIRKLVVLFENPGLLENPDDESTLVPRVEKEKIEDYLAFARGRMKKKILGAKRAMEGGVDVIYWADGRIENPILNALEGKGTVIS